MRRSISVGKATNVLSLDFKEFQTSEICVFSRIKETGIFRMGKRNNFTLQ